MIEVPIDIYVRTKSLDLWWGIYGLTTLTGWEDIFIYDSDAEDAKRIGFTCICTKNYLRSGLEDLEQDPEEKEFVEQILKYLEGNTIKYHYCFDNPTDDDFYELPYTNLPLNYLGVKPRYIEMWHPNEGINEEVIEECVKEFCSKFLDLEVRNVKMLEPVSFSEAVMSYSDQVKLVNGNVELVFTEDLMQKMMIKFSKERNEILELLKKST